MSVCELSLDLSESMYTIITGLNASGKSALLEASKYDALRNIADNHNCLIYYVNFYDDGVKIYHINDLFGYTKKTIKYDAYKGSRNLKNRSDKQNIMLGFSDGTKPFFSIVEIILVSIFDCIKIILTSTYSLFISLNSLFS